MSRLNQMGRLKRSLTPRDHLRARVSEGLVARSREGLEAKARALRGRLSIGHRGEVLATSDEGADLLLELSSELAYLVGDEVSRALEERSELRWEAFVGHCVQWWLPQQHHTPLLKALKERLADHAIELEIRWHEGVSVERLRVAPSTELYAGLGALAGVALGYLAEREGLWWASWLLLAPLGAVVGLLLRRPSWRCTAPQCGELMREPYAQCPHCGATLTAPKMLEVSAQRRGRDG